MQILFTLTRTLRKVQVLIIYRSLPHSLPEVKEASSFNEITYLCLITINCLQSVMQC